MMSGLVRSLAALALLLAATAAPAAPTSAKVGVNVLLAVEPSAPVLAALGAYGRVRDVLPELRAVTMQVAREAIPAVQALPYVAAVGEDAERNGAPIDTVPVADFGDGINTWNLDAVDVTDLGVGRVQPRDGAGVHVAVLDTGLLDSWRQYFPQERIAERFAVAFGGGGGEVGWVSSQPNKWQHDQSSHGTHVTSTILGYQFGARRINGVAPMATVIPVKVLNQNGSGWSSVIARGIVYAANLKRSGAVAGPLVINMSLGGSRLDPVEKAAIDYALRAGVLIVASAGNRGVRGMGYPGAYAPVISVAASGWTGEWTAPGSWWRTLDVREPTDPADFYIADFSSRELPGQDLDVAAPGSWILGPYQENSGQTSWFFLGGTSMACPHVAGIVALMAQQHPGLGQAEAEQYLEGSAIALPAGCRTVTQPGGATAQRCWGDDASGAGLVTAGRALAATP